MGTVIIPDGKVCSGKTTYSKRLSAEKRGVYLCADEALLRVFGENADMKMVGTAYGRLIEYVVELAAQIAENGIDVVLEIGFFTKQERDYYKDFYRSRGIQYEWHYLDVSDEVWSKGIAQRNASHERGEGGATFAINDRFLKMFKEKYVEPERSEVDVWVDNNW